MFSKAHEILVSVKDTSGKKLKPSSPTSNPLGFKELYKYINKMSTKFIFTEKKNLVHPSKILYHTYIPLNCMIGISLVKRGFHREIRGIEEFSNIKKE